MNLGTARAELEARGYSRFTDARLNQWLNQARVKFEDYPFDWPWLTATTTGPGTVTVSTLRRVIAVMDQTNRMSLNKSTAADIADFMDPTLTLTGAPAWWYLASTTSVATFPSNTATIAVVYQKFSPALTIDADTPLIPSEYHMDWVDVAEVLAIRWGVKDAATAAALEASSMQRLNEIAGVFAMMDEPQNAESLITGSSVDG